MPIQKGKEKPQKLPEAEPSITSEKPPVPETVEKPVEQAEKIAEAEVMEKAPAPAPAVKPSGKKEKVPAAKSENLIKIEGILQDGLADYYNEMPQNLKKTFKEKGEETAREIEKLLKSVKFNIKKIINLIFKWLKIIPGINKFYIEQEAKLKADRIVKEAREQNTPFPD